jgi:hypothetical protein
VYIIFLMMSVKQMIGEMGNVIRKKDPNNPPNYFVEPFK